jgi:hypothetical protein
MTEVLFSVAGYDVTHKRAAGIGIIAIGLLLIVALGMGVI